MMQNQDMLFHMKTRVSLKYFVTDCRFPRDMGYNKLQPAEFYKVKFNNGERVWEKDYIRFYSGGVSKINFSIQYMAYEGERILS